MISVIVPVYNVQNYVGQCIESIVMQTFTDIELILVDDGSTDASGKICDQYAMMDERIVVIHQENRGLSVARNQGLSVAKGTHVCFVDGDDYIHKSMLAYMMRIMEECHVKIVECNFERVPEQSSLEKIKERERIRERIRDAEVALFNKNEAMEQINVIACCKLYEAELFKNLRYPEGKYHEDEYVFHKIVYKVNKIAKTNASLYFYRMRDGSITSTKNIEKIRDAIEAYEERLKFIEEKEWLEVKNGVLERYIGYLLETYHDLKKELTELDKLMLREKMKSIVSKERTTSFECRCFARSLKLYEVIECVKIQAGKVKYYLDKWRA